MPVGKFPIYYYTIKVWWARQEGALRQSRYGHGATRERHSYPCGHDLAAGSFTCDPCKGEYGSTRCNLSAQSVPNLQVRLKKRKAV